MEVKPIKKDTVVKLLKTDAFCKCWNDIIEDVMKDIVLEYYSSDGGDKDYERFIERLSELQTKTDDFLRKNIDYATEKEENDDN